jgi:hypothetical protein
MKRRLVLAALAAMSAHAQYGEVPVSHDCHMWNEMAAAGTEPRGWYLVGLLHGIIQSAPDGKTRLVPLGADAGIGWVDAERGITEICKTPENAKLDVVTVLSAFKAKLEGTLTQEQVEEFLRGARKISAEAAAKTAADSKK